MKVTEGYLKHVSLFDTKFHIKPSFSLINRELRERIMMSDDCWLFRWLFTYETMQNLYFCKQLMKKFNIQ